MFYYREIKFINDSKNGDYLMKISVFALGRTGLPLSLICADSGFDVIGIDINEELVKRIKMVNYLFMNQK